MRINSPAERIVLLGLHHTVVSGGIPTQLAFFTIKNGHFSLLRLIYLVRCNLNMDTGIQTPLQKDSLWITIAQLKVIKDTHVLDTFAFKQAYTVF